jgi:hypothetical protein
MVEWMIVIALYAEDGSALATNRKGFQTKEKCEATLRLDLESTFRGVPAVKGHCVDFPVRPAGLPEPKAAKKEGRDA